MKLYEKNGKVKQAKYIVVRTTLEDGSKVQVINPTEEMILADGWVEYVPPVVEPRPYIKTQSEIVEELVVKQWNERTDISNNEAIEYAAIVYEWVRYLGQVLPVGRIVSYEERLWRVRQEHTAQESWMPSLDTASLWELIDVEHSGEVDDPIPYNPPMEIFNGKYYIQDEVVFLCIRDSEVPLNHNLLDLVGVYVHLI